MFKTFQIFITLFLLSIFICTITTLQQQLYVCTQYTQIATDIIHIKSNIEKLGFYYFPYDISRFTLGNLKLNCKKLQYELTDKKICNKQSCNTDIFKIQSNDNIIPNIDNKVCKENKNLNQAIYFCASQFYKLV